VPFFFLAKDKVDAWAARLAEEYSVYFPARIENQVHFHKFNLTDEANRAARPAWALEGIRAVEPVKAFLFAARETVASFPNQDRVPEKQRKQIIIGAKNCDLMPLRVHQKVFLEREFVDPCYKQRLSETVIVSADCPKPESSCLCNLLGLSPYAEAGSDLNLSALEDGYLLEPLSVVGRDLVFGRDKPFRPATDVEVDARDRFRREAVAKLKEINPRPWRKDLPDAIEQKKDEKFWRDAARDCVECYGCLTTCPTCFCYLLYDQKNGGVEKPQAAGRKPQAEPVQAFDRVKVWDACYYQGYARVGGGANVRPKLWERFRNRFHCKWMNCCRDWEFHSCSGCGRCSQVCMGKIDIRGVLGVL
jgi:NAD-dependent dihydropyrimidine dehydrogenase PreA subunit